MSSLKWLSGLWMPEPPGNTSHLDDLDRPELPRRIKGATLVTIGSAFRYLDADVVVVAVGSPDDAYPVRDGEVGIRAMSRADAVTLGWSPSTNGKDEAVTDLLGFLSIAEPITLVTDDLDEPIPYLPVDLLEDDGTEAEAIAPVSVPRMVRHASEPCDLRPRFSSQAGVAAHQYSPTRFGALNPSGGAVPKPNPAPSDDTTPSLVRLDLREAALERLAEKAVAWADTDPDQDEGRDTERDLLTAIAAFRAVSR